MFIISKSVFSGSKYPKTFQLVLKPEALLYTGLVEMKWCFTQRFFGSAETSVRASVAVSAETSLRSPRKLLIFITKENM